jgi:hypothetical protein
VLLFPRTNLPHLQCIPRKITQSPHNLRRRKTQRECRRLLSPALSHHCLSLLTLLVSVVKAFQGQRQMASTHQSAATKVSRTRACKRCYQLKTKCVPSGGSRCQQCVDDSVEGCVERPWSRMGRPRKGSKQQGSSRRPAERIGSPHARLTAPSSSGMKPSVPVDSLLAKTTTSVSID